MTEINESEHWIESPGGRLFAKSWTPGNPGSDTPLILFHDSLGCVALWRQFPQLLAETVNRRVIAYDRLGFGRSDRRTDVLSKDFVETEAQQYVPLLCEACRSMNSSPADIASVAAWRCGQERGCRDSAEA